MIKVHKHRYITSQSTSQKNDNKLVKYPATLTPNTTFKNLCLKAIGDFKSSGIIYPFSLIGDLK